MMKHKGSKLESACKKLTKANPNLLIPWYLMAAYAYYIDDDPIVSDQTFDSMAKKLLKNWDNITHIHKDHITKEDLEAGTFLGEYPSRVKFSVDILRKC